MKLGERVLARTFGQYLARRRLFNAEEAVKAEAYGHAFTADSLRAHAAEDSLLVLDLLAKGLIEERDLVEALRGYRGEYKPELEVSR